MSDVDEKSVTILPEKKKSTHFTKYTYQSVVCNRCKQLVGYLYSPMETDPSLVASCCLLSFFSLVDSLFDSSMGSYLDYVRYTKGWDIEAQIRSILSDIDTVSYRSKQTMVSLNKEFVVMREVVRSQTLFDIDIMGAFSENATSAFLFDYSQSPPTPYYSLFLPSSNASMHIDLEK